MKEQVETTGRDAVLVEDAHIRPMMGFEVLEPVPTRSVPYERLDPFILVHESRIRLSELKDVDTKHPHRGFDNLWYILEGSASTGHSTGPGGAIERARLPKGALLALRTGRGTWHAEAIGAEERGEGLGDTEWRSVLFWVNLARKDKQVEPSARVLLPEQMTVRLESDATVRVLVGEGSPVRLGTPALVLNIELPKGGEVTTPSRRGFRASPTCWKARPRSGPTGDGRSRPSWSSSAAVRRSPSPVPLPAHGTCSWRGSRTGRLRCSTARMWIR